METKRIIVEQKRAIKDRRKRKRTINKDNKKKNKKHYTIGIKQHQFNTEYKRKKSTIQN